MNCITSSIDQSPGCDRRGGKAAELIVDAAEGGGAPVEKTTAPAAAAAVDEADCEPLNGVETDVGKDALDDSVEGDLYVDEPITVLTTLDCSGCTSATSGARYLTLELVEVAPADVVFDIGLLSSGLFI